MIPTIGNGDSGGDGNADLPNTPSPVEPRRVEERQQLQAERSRRPGHARVVPAGKEQWRSPTLTRACKWQGQRQRELSDLHRLEQASS